MKSFKNLKSINFKKLIPGLISFAIIAGMAASTLATNLDLEAFVKKTDYLAKYHEQVHRIKDLDTELERIYKFVCTNVKTYAGSSYNNYYTPRTPFYFWQTAATYHYGNYPIADLSEEKYLRWNTGGMINQFGNHSKTDKMEFEIPASLCYWRDGIVPAPSCTAKFVITRTWGNSTSYSTNVTASNLTITMGPFTKFPKITSTGSTLTGGYICELPYNIGSYTQTSSQFQYAFGTETEPTSWSTDTGNLRIGLYSKGATNESKQEPYTMADLEADVYTKNATSYTTKIFIYNSAMVADLSSRENVWIRYVYNNTSGASVDNAHSASYFNITSWNHNN